LISGRKARASHSAEWLKREAHETDLATTAIEKTILEMDRISKEQATSPKEILEKVARLASPKRSDITVTAWQDVWVVRVGFDMAVMTRGEEGSSTKHTTKDDLKREVVEIISRVMKDLYDHCGDRGIHKIEVACKHGVREQVVGPSGFALSDLGFDTGTTVMKEIYRASIPAAAARKVSDWRKVPLHNVSDMLTVDHDEFPYLRISTQQVPSFRFR